MKKLAIITTHSIQCTFVSVSYLENEDRNEFKNKIEKTFLNFTEQNQNWQPNLKALDKYSAKESARKLVEAIEIITK